VLPRVSAHLVKMPDLIFRSGPLGLRDVFKDRPGRPMHWRLTALPGSGDEGA
jgi:hypothetical protein